VSSWLVLTKMHAIGESRHGFEYLVILLALLWLVSCLCRALSHLTAPQEGPHDDHVLKLLASDYLSSDGPGQMQQLLASHLYRKQSSMPRNEKVVVLQGIEDAGQSLLSVLNNALSESGNLQLDGAPVLMRGATFVLIMEMPFLSSNEEGEDYELMAKSSKDRLVEFLSRKLTDDDGSRSIIKALRRRIDVVLNADL
jgi:hypothetical protein